MTRKIRDWWKSQPPIKTQARKLAIQIRHREDQLFMVLTLVIGAVVGLTIVAFISLTDSLSSWLYPIGAQGQLRTFVIPAVGALFTGLLLFRFFRTHEAAGSPKPRSRSRCMAVASRCALF